MLKNSLAAMPDIDIDSLICNMPGFVMIKDLYSNYLNANLNTINEFGLKNSDCLRAYTDLTIPHQLSENGQLYRNLDLEVIQTGKPLQGICTFPFQGSIRPYRFRKSLLKDIHGNNIAIYSHAEECIDPRLTQFIHNLILDHAARFNQTGTTNNFILNKEYQGMQLSPLESCCFFYLIRQKTKIEIANILNLPTRVISSYIAKIKAQLNVNNAHDILDISVANGYINIVPPGIFNQPYYIHNHLSASDAQDTRQVANSKMKFTTREFDCAKLLINGSKIKEIAAIINLSPRTVETHLNSLKMKLDCRDKVELIIKLRDMAAEDSMFFKTL